MKRSYIILYHIIYWIYRVVHTLAFNHFIFHQNWYKGAYAVQLVLMPFFYTNYAVMIPALIKKNYTRFFIFTSIWLTVFVLAYSQWTVYQRQLLYGEPLRLPDYTETANNVIYIWLISACFCLFDFWMASFKKNQDLALDRKKHLLKSEENQMLNQLLSDYLDSLDHVPLDTIPDGIMKVSDFFKYVLYSRNKPVPFKQERMYLDSYISLKNVRKKKVVVHYEDIDDNIKVNACCILGIIERLSQINRGEEVLHVTLSSGKEKEMRVMVPMPDQAEELQLLNLEFEKARVVITDKPYRFAVSVDGYFTQTVGMVDCLVPSEHS